MFRFFSRIAGIHWRSSSLGVSGREAWCDQVNFVILFPVFVSLIWLPTHAPTNLPDTQTTIQTDCSESTHTLIQPESHSPTLTPTKPTIRPSAEWKTWPSSQPTFLSIQTPSCAARHPLTQMDSYSLILSHPVTYIRHPPIHPSTYSSIQTHNHAHSTHTCIFLGTCWLFHQGNGHPSTRTPTNLLKYILRSADCFSFQGYDEKDGQADEAW